MHRGFGPGASLLVALAVSVVISFLLIKSRFSYLAIPRMFARAPGGGPTDCMVVIPARNEEACIARAVRGFPSDTVIVVDDHSEDQTAEMARQAGAGVLKAPNPPRGVIGKSNACMAGARALTSRWVMFADADTSMEPEFLDTAVAYAEQHTLAFLSFYLQPEYETWQERMLIPMAIALYFSGVRSKTDPVALFNGQCMLVQRNAYEFLGGHSAVSRTISDDVKLAALARRHRMKLGIVRATNFGRVRMHGGFTKIWSGFERNALRFMLVSPWIGVTIMLTTVSLALWLPVLTWLMWNRQWVAAAAFALLPSILMWRWYDDSPWTLFAPIAFYGMLPIILNAFIAALTGRQVRWKGRVI